MKNPVYLSSRLDHSEHVSVSPDGMDTVSVPPGATQCGPFEAEHIQSPLPRGITTTPAGVNNYA